MRADNKLRRARRRRFKRRALLLRFQAAGEPRDRHAQRLEPPAQLAGVLLSENFGWRHQRGLITGIDGLRRSERGHDGLAAAHVALQQALHRMRQHEFARNLGAHPFLRAGQLERQRPQEARDQRFGHVRQTRHHRGGTGAALLVRAFERQLLREQFLELDARPRRMRTVDQRVFIGIGVRVMQRFYGVEQGGHVQRLKMRAGDFLRQQFRQMNPRQRAVDGLA